MALFVELGNTGRGGPSGVNMPVEIGSEVVSESVAGGGSTKQKATSANQVWTLTADANGYAKFGSGGERRILANQRLSFGATEGESVAWREA